MNTYLTAADATEHEVSTNCGPVSARSTTPRPGRLVPARDLHPGDVVQQYDWPLHVRTITLGPAAVAIAVAEFDFPLHYAADAPVQLAA
jgi:hypothetical protein